MAYTSAYPEHYLKKGTSGQAYDRSLANRFELAIFQLEHVFLLDLFQRLRSSDPATRYLDFACGTGRILTVFKDVPVLATNSPNKLFDTFAAGLLWRHVADGTHHDPCLGP